MSEEYVKDFDGWAELKKNIDRAGRMPTIKEGEVWWCGVGTNVGVEIGGKSSRHSRPVLILKKLSRFGFMAVPLTSKQKGGSWYVGFKFRGVDETAVVGQVRMMNVSRLYNKMGQVRKNDFKKVKAGFLNLFR